MLNLFSEFLSEETQDETQKTELQKFVEIAQDKNCFGCELNFGSGLGSGGVSTIKSAEIKSSIPIVKPLKEIKFEMSGNSVKEITITISTVGGIGLGTFHVVETFVNNALKVKSGSYSILAAKSSWITVALHF